MVSPNAVPIRQQVIQRRRIGKGGMLPHRGVVVLFVTVGAEGRRIEGNQCCAAGLRIPHALNGRMNLGDFILSSCNKALHPCCITIFLVLRVFPCLTDQHIFLWICSIDPKNQICPRCHFLQLANQRRMLCGVFRLPSVKESKYRFCNRRIYTVQQSVMQFSCVIEALSTSLRILFLLDAQ